MGVWSFNYDYCIGIKIFEMPIEEWLFFLIIPFCSLFIHFCAITVNPKFRFNKKATISLTVFFIILSIIVVLLNPSKKYTAVQYAMLTSFMMLPGKFFSGFSGMLADYYVSISSLQTGWAYFFYTTSAMSIPALLLIVIYQIVF